MSEKSIEIVREYNFDPKEVIKGLNGYYESDKRNNYITIRRNDVEGPAYLSTPIYLSALIEWLREDFDIFYRPGLTLEIRCVVREKESENEELKDIKEHGYRYDGLETKSVEEIVDWIITMATCPRDEWAKDEIENLRSQITRLKDLINAMNEEVGDM